jgi:hypothetical protein
LYLLFVYRRGHVGILGTVPYLKREKLARRDNIVEQRLRLRRSGLGRLFIWIHAWVKFTRAVRDRIRDRRRGNPWVAIPVYVPGMGRSILAMVPAGAVSAAAGGTSAPGSRSQSRSQSRAGSAKARASRPGSASNGKGYVNVEIAGLAVTLLLPTLIDPALDTVMDVTNDTMALAANEAAVGQAKARVKEASRPGAGGKDKPATETAVVKRAIAEELVRSMPHLQDDRSTQKLVLGINKKGSDLGPIKVWGVYSQDIPPHSPFYNFLCGTESLMDR